MRIILPGPLELARLVLQALESVNGNRQVLHIAAALGDGLDEGVTG